MIAAQLAPEFQAHKKAFTVDEYRQMLLAGILTEESRTELIKGDIFYMSPIGTCHASCTDRLNHRFYQKLSEAAIIRVQNPVLLNDTSEVEPDIAVLKKRADFYAAAHPTPEDVLLIVEISDTSPNYRFSDNDCHKARGKRSYPCTSLTDNAVTTLSGSLYDKDIKLPLYAASGITEVWLVNLKEASVDVHTEPSGRGYATRKNFWRGREIVSTAFPEIGLTVDDIIGEC